MIIRDVDVGAAGGPLDSITSSASVVPQPAMTMSISMSASVLDPSPNPSSTLVLAPTSSLVAALNANNIPGIPNPDRTRPGVIVGAVVGSVTGALVLLFALFWWKGKGCVRREDKNKPDPESQPSSVPQMEASRSRVSFATARTTRTERTDRSAAPSPPATPVRGTLETQRADQSGVSTPVPRDDIDGLDVSDLSPPARTPSRASVGSRASKVSKLSRASLPRLSATLARSSSGNLTQKQGPHYTTTTDRLRDRPFSTIYDADSVAWDAGDVANLADLDIDAAQMHRRHASGVSRATDGSAGDVYDAYGRDDDNNPMNVRYHSPIRTPFGDRSGNPSRPSSRPTSPGAPQLELHLPPNLHLQLPEVTVHDPELRTDSSGTPSPTATLAQRTGNTERDVAGRERRLSARERMLGLYSGSHTSLATRRTSEEREREERRGHYTRASERELEREFERDRR